MRHTLPLSCFLCVLLTSAAVLACSVGPPEGITWPRRDRTLAANANIVFESAVPVQRVLVNGTPVDIEVEPVPSWFYLGSLIHTAGRVMPGDIVTIVADENRDGWARREIEVSEETALSHVETPVEARYYYRHTDTPIEGDGGASCGPGWDWDTEVAVEFDLPADGQDRLVWMINGERSFAVVTPQDYAFMTDIYTADDAQPPCVTVAVDDLHGGRWTEELCAPDRCAVGAGNALLPVSTRDYPAYRDDWNSLPEGTCGMVDDDGDEGEPGDDSVFERAGGTSGRGNSEQCAVPSVQRSASWWGLLVRR